MPPALNVHTSSTNGVHPPAEPLHLALSDATENPGKIELATTSSAPKQLCHAATCFVKYYKSLNRKYVSFLEILITVFNLILWMFFYHSIISFVCFPRYSYGQLIEINSHSLFSKWFSEESSSVILLQFLFVFFKCLSIVQFSILFCFHLIILHSWSKQSGKLVMKMFQKIQELIDDKDALVCVLIDEVHIFWSSL